MEALEGMAELERTLIRIERHGVPKVVAAGVRAMQMPLKSAIRRGVSGSNASTGLKRAAKATIGSKVKKEKGEYGMKVGFGAGRSSKAKKAKASARAVQGRSRSGGGTTGIGGVGISASNIHWAVLGTTDRRHKSGKSVGRMKPFLLGIVPAAVKSGTPLAMQRAADKAKAVLRIEALKQR